MYTFELVADGYVLLCDGIPQVVQTIKPRTDGFVPFASQGEATAFAQYDVAVLNGETPPGADPAEAPAT